jgi:hypothetical protein
VVGLWSSDSHSRCRPAAGPRDDGPSVSTP